jgi:hypothetical protein
MSNIGHFTGVRMRVVGSGNLKLQFQSLDEVETEVMAELAMSNPNSRESFRLANMTTFRAGLRIETDEINEYFKIGSIVIYVKRVASEFPA